MVVTSFQHANSGCVLSLLLFNLALVLVLPIGANANPRMNPGGPRDGLDSSFERHFDVSNANNANNFSYLSIKERIDYLITRDKLRIEALYAKIYGQSALYSSRRKDLDAVSLPLEFGQTFYEYLTRIQLGTPPREFLGVADTGSDLIGIPCDPCPDCFSEDGFETDTSTTFDGVSCNNGSCSALGGSPFCTASGDCGYNYTYGKGYVYGELSSDTLTLNSTGGHIETFPDLVFGCVHQTGEIPDPYWGLGRGQLSLVSQLTPTLGAAFDFCFPTYFENKTTQLVLGSTGASDPELSFTPLLPNPSTSQTYYFVNVTGISVNGSLLDISPDAFSIDQNERGGLFLDTGTSFTHLSTDIYQSLLSEVESLVTAYTSFNLTGSDLDLCYDVTDVPSTTTEINDLELPTITFHFQDLDMILPLQNTFIKFDFTYNDGSGRGVAVCLAMEANNFEGITPSIFGNYQMQNYYYLFDPSNDLVGWKPRTC